MTLALMLWATVFPLVLHAQSKQVVALKTVVIDAGHGGHDPGATNGKTYEKNITLAVATRLGNLIKKSYPDVKVIYTRSDDRFVELYRRAEIANKNNADLFISIHVNSAASSAARGHETFVMGQGKNSENFEICQKENSVIVLEDDYTSNYQGFDPDNPESYIIFSLLQNSHLEQSLDFATMVQKYADSGPIANNRGVKQANFIVLWKCTMPAVLIELGFISNSSDMRNLTDKSSQQRIAENIFKAFREYKKGYDTEVYISGTDSAAPSSMEQDTRTSRETETAISGNNGGGRFGIQILASRKLLSKNSPEFRGWSCRYIKSGRMYKYYIGSYDTREEARQALPKIKNSFPEAFIISIEQQ